MPPLRTRAWEHVMKPQSMSLHSSSRRQVVVGLAGLSLASLLTDPAKVAQAAASLQTVTTKTPSGRSVSAALAAPDQKPAAAVLLIHEWWGLNDQIKSVASEIAKQGLSRPRHRPLWRQVRQHAGGC
jgi:carboxymethylenebutenolidase